MRPQIRFKAGLCVGCGACVTACKQGAHRLDGGVHQLDFAKCSACGDCVKVCCYNALTLCGRRISAEEAVSEILRDREYYENGGGLTLSGGEPLAQPEFASAVAAMAQEASVSVCVETSGYCSVQALEMIADSVDCFLLDWKISDTEKHKQLVGVDHTVILRSLQWLDAHGKKIVLRCPIIPGVNDEAQHFQTIADLQKRYPAIDHVELLPYHTMGESKKTQIGRSDSFRSNVPDAQAKRQWLSTLQSFGCNAVLG